MVLFTTVHPLGRHGPSVSCSSNDKLRLLSKTKTNLKKNINQQLDSWLFILDNEHELDFDNSKNLGVVFGFIYRRVHLLSSCSPAFRRSNEYPLPRMQPRLRQPMQLLSNESFLYFPIPLHETLL